MAKSFQSAEDRVEDDEFEDVLAVLAASSPWQEFIAPNLREARKSLSGSTFKIVSSKEFAKVASALNVDGADKVPGVTDKENNTIVMQEWFGQNSHAARLGHVLHESVHWVSHIPGPGKNKKQKNSTALAFLGEGILEGLVECVMEDILTAQRIALARASLRGHQERVTIVRKLMETLSGQIFGRVLFLGEKEPFDMIMRHTYTPGWAEIRALAKQNQVQRALERIPYWRQVADAEHAKETEIVQQQLRKLQKPPPATPAPGAGSAGP
jgi:hypothetical protein